MLGSEDIEWGKFRTISEMVTLEKYSQELWYGEEYKQVTRLTIEYM